MGRRAHAVDRDSLDGDAAGPVMVGLPARGKSYIGQKISRYLNWMGVVTKVFNVGQYRRTFYGNHHSHEWFAPDNAESQKLRQHAAQSAADDMLE